MLQGQRWRRYDDVVQAIIIAESRERRSHQVVQSFQNVSEIIGLVLAEVFILGLPAHVPANHNGGLNIDLCAGQGN